MNTQRINKLKLSYFIQMKSYKTSLAFLDMIAMQLNLKEK